MDTVYELESVKKILLSIVSEADDVADRLAMDFKGINAEKCADYLHKLALGYRMAVRELDNLEFSELEA